MPWPLALVSNLTLVSSEITFTAALGTTAPIGSVTRPLRVARTSWAAAQHASINMDVSSLGVLMAAPVPVGSVRFPDCYGNETIERLLVARYLSRRSRRDESAGGTAARRAGRVTCSLSGSGSTDPYDFREFILAAFGYLDDDAYTGFQIGQLSLLTVLGQFGLIVQLHVDIALVRLHGQHIVRHLNDRALDVLEAAVGKDRRCHRDQQ